MKLFKDRTDAGKQLAQLLLPYKRRKDVIVVALVRGGVPVAAEISPVLHAPLDIVVVRKIGDPGAPEFALGALTQSGEPLFNEQFMQRIYLAEQAVLAVIDQEKQELQRRLERYRGTKAPLNCQDKTVILVDDGIATGATMRAAIASVKSLGAKKVVVAVPVCPQEVVQEFELQCDEFVCLEQPAYFPAVGYFYEQFEPVEDEQVSKFIQQATVLTH